MICPNCNEEIPDELIDGESFCSCPPFKTYEFFVPKCRVFERKSVIRKILNTFEYRLDGYIDVTLTMQGRSRPIFMPFPFDIDVLSPIFCHPPSRVAFEWEHSNVPNLKVKLQGELLDKNRQRKIPIFQ